MTMAATFAAIFAQLATGSIAGTAGLVHTMASARGKAQVATAALDGGGPGWRRAQAAAIGMVAHGSVGDLGWGGA